MDLEIIKKEMWAIHTLTLPTSLRHCYTCYNMSDSICQCAEQRFYNRLTDKDIEDYFEEKKDRELKVISKQIDELTLLENLYK